MTDKQIIEKLSKKDLLTFMSLKDTEKNNFLTEKRSIIEKRESKKDKMKKLLEGIRIEVNDEGLLIDISKDLLESEVKENYTQKIDFSQYGNFGKSTVQLTGTDGKKYGLLLTVLEYK